MNKIEKRRGKVTLLCGISASGKTRYSQSLERSGAVRLSVDEEMWRRYGAGFTTFPSEEQRRLTLEVEDYIRGCMRSLLLEGREVVVDSCLCKRFKREAFEHSAREVDADVSKIYLTASRDVLLSRLSRRRGDDANDIVVTPVELDRFLTNFQVPEDEEGYEVVDTGECH